MTSLAPSALRCHIGKPIAQAFQKWEEVQGELVKIQEHLFALLDDPEDGTPREKMRIHGLLWAASKGAALRAWFNEIEADDESIHLDAALGFTSLTYAEILSELNVADRPYIESASYRIMSDGKFIHKSIQTIGSTYFFRSQEIEGQEAVYAILHTSA